MIYRLAFSRKCAGETYAMSLDKRSDKVMQIS